MAEKIKENQFDKVGVNPFNAPVPGESLTAPTDMPKAWEKPPQYTDVDDCMESIYLEITQESTLRELVTIINEGTPLDDIANVILYRGYTQGLWNPDILLQLIEPTIYLLIAIADYADISDYTLYNEEVDDPDTEIPEDTITPVMMDDDEEEVKEEKRKPKKDSLGESLLSRVESELPAKVADIKEKE